MAAASTRSRVLGLFKKLLRTQKIVFERDAVMQERVTLEIRNKFKERANAPSEQVAEFIKEGEETDAFLREHVVQAEYNPETGNYTQKMRPDHAWEGDITGRPLEEGKK
uniref:Uncharacterized protein n=1 Tax=Lotharella oceanica TaxID=641309 RepID=A0A7S2XAZ0_9EUKA|mmetsp:Transcript_24764/g.46263  ORF Transcript_24764/g.46263 Transcript_24764/m.46263 type:complete len:109 (+) Transcript_24764:31-357(+)